MRIRYPDESGTNVWYHSDSDKQVKKPKRRSNKNEKVLATSQRQNHKAARGYRSLTQSITFNSDWSWQPCLMSAQPSLDSHSRHALQTKYC